MADFSLSGGVRTLGYISPFDTNDTYAVIDTLYGIDGLRNVNNITELNTITTERRRSGMVVGVDNTTGTTYYTLKNSPWSGTSVDWFETHTVSDNLISFTSTIDAQTYLSGGTNLIDIIKNDGDIIDAQNVGSGAGIFRNKSGTTLNFRTLTGVAPSNKITAAVSGDTVRLDIVEQQMTLWPLVVTGNKLISGNVTFVSGLTFDVSALEYIIGSVVYNTSSSQVTLNSGDTSFDRIDVIYVDVSGNTGVVNGTPTSNPSKPNVNTSTQVEVTFVTVPAGSSTPDVSITKIYDENLGSGGGEWDYSATTAVRISGDSTSDAFSGSKSVEFISATTSDSFTMTIPTPYDLSDDNIITFYIKNKVAWNGNSIDISLLDSGNTINGSIITLQDPLFGFDDTNISGWQIISIDLSSFNLSSNLASKVRFEVTSPTDPLNLFIDLIRFQSGAATVSPQNIWYSIIGDDNNTTDATSPTDQLRLSGGTNITTSVDNKRVTFDVTSGISATFIGDGSVTNNEYQFLSGVTSNIQNQIDNITDNNDYVSGGTFNDTTKLLSFSGTNTATTFTVSLSALSTEDNYISGGTYVDGGNVYNSNSVVLNDNTGGTVTITNVRDTYLTGQTFNNSNYNLTTSLNDGSSEVTDLSILATDMVVTGGTYDINNGIVTFTNNSGGTFNVSGFTSGMTDSYTTAANVSASTESITFDNNLNGSNYYNVSLTPLLSGKTDNTTFSAYTSTTNTTLLTKVDGGLNVGDGEGVFRDKTGTTLNFKTIKSTGSTFDISNLGDEINLDVNYATIDTRYVNVTGDTMTGTLYLNGGDNTDPSLVINQSGTLSGTPVAGAFEFDGPSLYFTDSLNIRHNVLLGSSGVTATTLNSLTDVNASPIEGSTFYFDATTGFWGESNIISINDTSNLATINNLSATTISAETSYLSILPTFNGSATDLLVRNSVTGEIEYRPVSGITPDTNTFVTGYTYEPTENKFTIGLNNGSAYTSTIASVSGLTINGSLSATTIYSGGTNLDQIFTQDAFTTFSSTTSGQGSVVADNVNDQINFSGVNINILTNDTTNTITFSADTEVGEVNTATNVGGETEIFSGKSGVDLQFRTLESSGGTVNFVTTTGGTINIEAPHTIDTNDFVTGGTLTSGGTIVLEKNNDVDTSPIDLTGIKRYVITADQSLAISAGRSYLTDTGVSLLSFNNVLGTENEEASFNFSVPSDYVTGGTFYIKMTTLSSTPPNNETQMVMNVTSIDLNGDLSTATDTGISGVTSASTTSWEIVESPIYIPVSSTFSVNKNVSVKINRNVQDIPDTYGGNVYVWGLVFEYTGIR